MRDNNRSMKIILLAATFWKARGVIAGLGLTKRDARTYMKKDSKHNLTLILTGMGQARARRAAQQVLQSSPGLVISTGFAGALKEEIQVGDLVIDNARSDPKWAGHIAELAQKGLIPAHGGPFFSSGEPLLTVREKVIKAQETGAVAVEMESQAVFEVMKAGRIPFLSVRAVCDTLYQGLPPVVLEAADPAGLNLALFWNLLIHPRQWGSFWTLVRSSGKAEESLAKILKEFVQNV